jgi:transposase
MAGRRLEALVLTEVEKSELTALTARPKTAQALAERARIVLACADGLENKAVGQQLDVHPQTVGKWRRRFLAQRMEGLRDEPRPGAPRTIEDQRIEAVISRTLESQPKGATHWSSRGMARQTGLSVSTVQRIWRAFGLKPHRQETFKLSTDPDFVAKVRDVVGLYLSPPEHALVLSVDEKSQIQALDRSQAVFPMRPGQAQRRSHDYVRHGTTSLFAALDRRHRGGHRQMLSTPSRHGVPSVPRRDRGQGAGRAGCASDLGQLRDTQDRADSELACQAPALACSSYADQQFLVEPDRAVFRPTDRTADQTRRAPQRR